MVTSFLVMMLVFSAVAHARDGDVHFNHRWTILEINRDTSYEAFSKKYPILISCLRKENRIKESEENTDRSLSVANPEEKKKSKVYYWIRYEQPGEEEVPQVNSSHRLVLTLFSHSSVKRVQHIKEPFPLKINVLNF